MILMAPKLSSGTYSMITSYTGGSTKLNEASEYFESSDIATLPKFVKKYNKEKVKIHIFFMVLHP